MHSFAEALKHWRHLRRLSQLDLAMAADISARHLAFLETGRSNPSRTMLLHLAQVLGVPRGSRNVLLQLAGFAATYPAQPLDAQDMAPVQAAMEWTVTRHAPYPALVMDSLWRLITLNAPATELLSAIGLGRGDSMLDALTDPLGARAAIQNWAEVGYHTMLRLRRESALAGGVPELDATANHLAQDKTISGWHPPAASPVIMPTIFALPSLQLSLFSTYASFGTVEDVALAEMKIELMFPADDATRVTLLALSAGAS